MGRLKARLQTRKMVEEQIILAIAEKVKDDRLHFQIIIGEGTLHIYINRDTEESLNYDRLTSTIHSAISELEELNLLTMELFSRVLGEVEKYFYLPELMQQFFISISNRRWFDRPNFSVISRRSDCCFCSHSCKYLGYLKLKFEKYPHQNKSQNRVVDNPSSGKTIKPCKELRHYIRRIKNSSSKFDCTLLLEV